MTDNPERDTKPGCYICQPNNPHAAPEGCDVCDRDAFNFAKSRWEDAADAARRRNRKLSAREPDDDDDHYWKRL